MLFSRACWRWQPRAARSQPTRRSRCNVDEAVDRASRTASTAARRWPVMHHALPGARWCRASSRIMSPMTGMMGDWTASIRVVRCTIPPARCDIPAPTTFGLVTGGRDHYPSPMPLGRSFVSPPALPECSSPVNSDPTIGSGCRSWLGAAARTVYRLQGWRRQQARQVGSHRRAHMKAAAAGSDRVKYRELKDEQRQSVRRMLGSRRLTPSRILTATSNWSRKLYFPERRTQRARA